MIDHFEDLSLDDKLFALVNINNFSLPSKSNILFNKTDTIDSVTEKCGKWCIDKAFQDANKIKENAKILARKYSGAYPLMCEMITDMLSLNSESAEDIKNIIFLYKDYHRRIKGIRSLVTDNNSNLNKNLAEIFMYIFINVNLRVHEIWCKSKKVYSGDDLCEDEICKSLLVLFKLLLNTIDNNETIDILCIISRYFGDTDKLSDCLATLITDFCSNNSFSKDELISSIESNIKNGNLDFSDSKLKFSDINILHNKENYDKDILCERLRRGGAIIGKNVLGDIDVEEATIEIDKLTDEFISSIDENFKSFTINENKIGELINEGCNAAVYCKNNGLLRHIINYENNPYLLYENGDNNLHGINLEMGNGKRYLLDIIFPSDISGVKYAIKL